MTILVQFQKHLLRAYGMVSIGPGIEDTEINGIQIWLWGLPVQCGDEGTF